MAALWGGDFVEGRCTVLPQASLALSVQWEALDPVRPRGGSAICKWLGLAPPAPSSAPRGPRGPSPTSVTSWDGSKVTLGHVCGRALQAQQRGVHTCVRLCMLCTHVYACGVFGCVCLHV